MASYGKPCDNFLELMVYSMQMIEAEHEKSDQIILHHKGSTMGITLFSQHSSQFKVSFRLCDWLLAV